MQFKIICLSCKSNKASTKHAEQCVFHLTIDKVVEKQKNRWIECRHPEKLKFCPMDCNSKSSSVDYDPQCNGKWVLVELDYKVDFSIDVFQRIQLFKTQRDDYSIHSFITSKGNVFEIDKRAKVYRDVMNSNEYKDIYEYYQRYDDKPIVLAFLRDY